MLLYPEVGATNAAGYRRRVLPAAPLVDMSTRPCPAAPWSTHGTTSRFPRENHTRDERSMRPFQSWAWTHHLLLVALWESGL